MLKVIKYMLKIINYQLRFIFFLGLPFSIGGCPSVSRSSSSLACHSWSGGYPTSPLFHSSLCSLSLSQNIYTHIDILCWFLLFKTQYLTSNKICELQFSFSKPNWKNRIQISICKNPIEILVKLKSKPSKSFPISVSMNLSRLEWWWGYWWL